MSDCVLHPNGCYGHGGSRYANISGNNVTWSTGGSFVLGNIGKRDGKIYWEVHINAVASTCTLGLVNKERLLSSEPTDDGFGYRNTGQLYSYGVAKGTAMSYAAGDIVNLAVDLNQGDVWVGVNGTWYNSGDPATGANPSFTGLTYDVYFPYLYSSNTTNDLTARFSTSDISYPVPSGFSTINNDSGVCYTFAIEDFRAYGSSVRGSWLNNPNTISNSYFRFGSRASGSSYNLFFPAEKLYVPSGASVLSAKIYFDGGSSATAVANAKIYFERSTSPSAPTTYAEAEALSLTTNYIEWLNIQSFDSSHTTIEESPDITQIVNEIISLPGWSYGDDVQVIIKDFSSDVSVNREIQSKREGYAIESMTLLFVEYRVGSITYEVGREDQTGIDDAVDGGVTPSGIVSDTAGMGDVTEAPLPAHGKPIDGVGIGDEVIADHLVETVSEEIGLGDHVDSFSLSPIAEDNVGLNDFIDSYVMSVGATDGIGLGDTTDATADATFNLNSIEHRQEIPSAEITVTQAPQISAEFTIPGPSFVADMGGIQAEFTIPGPAFTAELANLNQVSAEFTIPGPAFVAEIAVNTDLSAEFTIPGPSFVAEMKSGTGITAEFSIPGPTFTAEISHATDLNAEFTIPGPAFTAEMSQESRFGILEHSRC